MIDNRDTYEGLEVCTIDFDFLKADCFEKIAFRKIAFERIISCALLHEEWQEDFVCVHRERLEGYLRVYSYLTSRLTSRSRSRSRSRTSESSSDGLP